MIEQEADAKFNAQQEEYKKNSKPENNETIVAVDHPKRPALNLIPKRQYNFTDPDSRVMIDGATKSFQQSYNCQAAVDDKSSR